MPDLYKTLGVKRTATIEQIKQAFRAKARKHHPDRNVGDKKASERFQAVTLAYRILSDSERRKRYDETGDTQDMSDNSVTKLVSMLSQLFQQVVVKLLEQKLDIKQQDISAMMRDCCISQLTEISEQRKSLEKAKANISTLSGRFSVKQGDNLMDEIVTFEITKIDRQMQHLIEVEQLLKSTFDWLKDCFFKKDEDPIKAVLREALVTNGAFAGFRISLLAQMGQWGLDHVQAHDPRSRDRFGH